MKRVFKNRIGELTASVILGFFEVSALSLYYRDSLGFWTASVANVLIFAGLWLASAAVIDVFFRLIQFLARPRFLIAESRPVKNSFVDRHPFLLAAAVLMIFYLPWILVFYPGSAVYDMMYQTVQADGFLAINAHHPIFSTYVIGLCSQAGLKLTGGLNAGIFLYILLQSAVCIFSFAYMISFMARQGAARSFWIATLCILAVFPLWGGAMQCGTKDTMFTGIYVLFLVLSAQLLAGEGGPVKAGAWVAYGLLIVLLCLYRNGIILVLIPTLAVFFFVLRKEKKTKKLFAVVALVSLAAAAAFNAAVRSIYHTKTETGEMLSLPFQQTARYVRDHSGEMMEEEQQMVETTFALEDYRELGTLYYPMSADPVKARYHWWASDQEKEVLRAYFEKWFSMLKKQPGTYWEAALSKTCGYYSIIPVIRNQKGGAGTTVQFGPDQLAVRNVVEASGGALSEDLIPESPAFLAPAQKALSSWYFLWQKIPVLDLFSKCGFYFMLLLAVTLYYGKRKNKLIALAVPAFLLILMAIASPVNEHIRYILPVAATVPFIAGAAGAEHIKKELPL